MNIELLICIILFGSMVLFLLLGHPLVFVMGGVAVLATYLFWNPSALYMFPIKTFKSGTDFMLLAIPMFIFMGSILLKTGITDELYNMMYHWLGGIQGGLAVGTVIICTVWAAIVGVSGAATVSMGIIALPSMLKRGYNEELALGTVAAGGALGVLIPPSVLMIALGAFTGTSIGMLLIGGILPGLLLSFLFIVYILVRCKLNPKLGPTIETKEKLSLKDKFVLTKSLIFPVAIIVTVMGSILAGIATPSEASGVGVLMSILCAFFYRRLTWGNFKNACEETLKYSCMVMWIIFAASSFASVFAALGATQMIQKIMIVLPGGRWGIMIAMQFVYFIMGMFLDPIGIIMLTAPIFFPLAIQLGFNPVWVGVIYVMNMQMGFLTPPFGYNLFYLKAVAPRNITMSQIYRSIVPFVILQATGLVVCMLWPKIILWLPSLMIK
ncbi:C4-dicarboxylate TRAP transporter large permease protein DctM [subsurface metagenome]